MSPISKKYILINFVEDSLCNTLSMYFSRLGYYVFSDLGKQDRIDLTKYHAMTHAIIGQYAESSECFALADELFNFDNRINIFFICSSIEEKDKVLYHNPAFFVIMKPFAMRYLNQRMNDAATKSKDEQNNITNFKLGSYIFNFNAKNLRYTLSQPIENDHLNKKEAHILLLLCRNMNKTVPRARILQEVWRKDDYKTARSMDVYMASLRKKLKKDDKIKIRNIPYIGFALEIQK